MLYLHVSNRTENLLKHLTGLLEVSGRRDVFAREHFLIQSQGMERMISQTLARSFTSWCNFEFYLPLAFLQYSARQLGMELSPDGYDRKVMVWRFEELLRELDGEVYQPLEQYLSGENQELKRYQLADQLANVFDQYQLMRPEMLAGWQDNKLCTDHPAEAWQRALWLRLTERLDGTPHRGLVLQQVVDRLNSGDDYSTVLPERVSVFGLSIMPPLFLAYLQGLARHVDVHLFVLSPCQEYWGDIESRRRRLLLGVNGDGMVDDSMVESHPLLVSLGQQGRDFQRMLFDDVHFELEFNSYEEPLADGEVNLLRQLQQDLLTGEITRRTAPWPHDDTSIRIVSCHSKLREMHILREHMLRWLYEYPDLELRDIVVMAPDIQEYAPLIPAVFADIQHSVSDRSMRRRNPVLAAFTKFLALFQGRFGWNEVLDVLREEPVATKLQLSSSDLETIQHWVTGAGIRWGLSTDHRAGLGLPHFGECSWQSGLERLLMGYAIDSDQLVDGVLPYTEIEGGGAHPLGGLCQLIALLEKGRKETSKRYPLAQWSALLMEYARELFQDETAYGDTREYLELQQILSELGEEQGCFHTGEVDFAVISAWLEHVAAETRSSSGFLRGQVTFCSMLPMRSIPFKVVCLIGLNEGVFPKNDRFATFDLMSTSHRPGDRSRRMDDRYQFLEALVAARDALYLSYIGQSSKNNEKIPPSVVVTELLEVLEQWYQAGERVTHHPLHPFSVRYFNNSDANLFSYDQGSCELAVSLREKTKPGESWWQGCYDTSPLAGIGVDQLIRFFSNPQKFFVRDCLGIRLAEDDELAAESEPFEAEGLDRYLIDQELVGLLLDHQNIGHREQDRIYTRLCLDGRWPLGTSGKLLLKTRLEELAPFVRSIRSAALGRPIDDLQIDLEVGGYPVTGKLTNLFEGGILIARFAKLKAKDLMVGWLHHQLYAKATGTSRQTMIFGSDGCWTFGPAGDISPDLALLVSLFVDGCTRPSPLYLEPGLEWARKRRSGRGMEMESAVARLERMLGEGYDRELILLMRNSIPEEVLDEEFEDLAERVILPIWSCADEG